MAALKWLSILIAVVQVYGGQNSKNSAQKCFVVPKEDVLVVAANVPDSPIEVVAAHCVGFLDGGSTEVYSIQNRSSKSISGYTIAIVDSDGAETRDSITISLPSAYFRQGEVRARSSSSEHREIVPLTDQLRERYRLNGALKVIKVIIVVRVEFADGSVYDAERAYKSLKRFLDKDDKTSSGIREK